MNLNELRIGNYVLMNGVASELLAINEHELELRMLNGDILAYQRNNDEAKILPIPLATTLLADCCGFNEYAELLVNVNDHVHTLWLHNDGHITLLDKRRMPLIHFWDVKHLHQLQNLYCVLCLDEMKVSFSRT